MTSTPVAPADPTEAAPVMSFAVEFVTTRHAVVHVRGDVDHSNAWVIASVVDGAALSGCDLVEVAIRDVTFADSAFVLAMVACAREAHGCDIVLTEPSAQLVRLLDILGAAWLLEVRPDTPALERAG